MGRKLAFLGIAVLLAGGSFAAGWAVCSRGRNAADTQRAAHLAAELKEVSGDDLPALEGWDYPEARVGPGGGVIGYGASRQLLHVDFALGKYRVLTTPDDFGKVVAFYEKKCAEVLQQAGLRDREEGEGKGEKKEGGPPGDPQRGSGVWGATRDEKCGGSFGAHDSLEPGPGETPRPVQTCLLGMRSNNYSVTIFVSRAQGEKLTHIALVLDRWSIRPVSAGPILKGGPHGRLGKGSASERRQPGRAV